MSDHAAKVAPLSNTAYDILKPITTTVLPGLSALYVALATLWNFPYGAEIVGTIAAINVFLGGFVTYSNQKYKNNDDRFAGQLVVDQNDEEGIKSHLELGQNFEQHATNDEIVFKVNKETSQ